MSAFLPFERRIAELEGRIAELRANAREDPHLDVEKEIQDLEKRVAERLHDIYAKLTPWQRCQIARHPERPHAVDVVTHVLTDFVALAGDRGYAEDFAIIGGLARHGEQSIVFIGQEKGNDTQSRIERNFGMSRPEGYRKAIRLMELAERFGLPVVTVVDTPGAYPGPGAEERGQAEAIARTIETSLSLTVPIITIILGEGGSGGAVALAVANRMLMLEHAVYSVISPEGCASILWRDVDKAETAAAALRLTAKDMLQFGVVDRIIDEPEGGAHREPRATLATIGAALGQELSALASTSPAEVREARRQRFASVGAKLG